MKTTVMALLVLATACARPLEPECTRDADCASTPCMAAACDDGACVAVALARGAIADEQTVGNCMLATCDGSGNVVEVADDDNVPASSNACVATNCTGGAPTSADVAAGSACGSGVCNGAGDCVACLVGSACPGSDTACATRTCLGGVCGVDYTPAGTVTTEPAPPCQDIVCDGSGGTTTANLPSGTGCTVQTTPGEDTAGSCDGDGNCLVVGWSITNN